MVNFVKWSCIYLGYNGSCLDGVAVMLNCWKGRFGRHCHAGIWNVIPLCIMWCIWKVRHTVSSLWENSCRVEDIAIEDFFFFFFNGTLKTLLDCLAACHCLSISNLFEFLDIFINLILEYLLYASDYMGCAPLCF